MNLIGDTLQCDNVHKSAVMGKITRENLLHVNICEQLKVNMYLMFEE